MPKPELHGRDHRPAKYGGTAVTEGGGADPVTGMLYLPSASETTGQVLTRDTAAAHGIKWATSSGSGASNISAVGIAYGRSLSTGAGRLEFDFDEVWWNDATFGYSTVSSSRARYITLSQEGFYEAHFMCFWNSDFASGFPYIEPTVYVGFRDLLVNTASLSWNDTQGVIYGEQFTAAEYAHHSLVARVLFNFTAADFGYATPGLGVSLNAPGGVTKNFGAMLAITWLGDTLASQTIV